MIKNLLWGTRTYLAGNLEYSGDVQNWRDRATMALSQMGVKVMSPTTISFLDQPAEDPQFRTLMRQWRDEGEFDKIEAHMKQVIEKDLRMIDLCDFCIINLEVDKPTFGTVHELVEAARQQKPIFLIIADEKKIPFWISGLVKREHIYRTLEDVLYKLVEIDRGNVTLKSKKWKLLIPSLR